MAQTGEDTLVPWNNDKASVVALREIAAGKVDQTILSSPLEQDFQLTPHIPPALVASGGTQEASSEQELVVEQEGEPHAKPVSGASEEEASTVDGDTVDANEVN